MGSIHLFIHHCKIKFKNRNFVRNQSKALVATLFIDVTCFVAKEEVVVVDDPLDFSSESDSDEKHQSHPITGTGTYTVTNVVHHHTSNHNHGQK